jgi:hypothetical protein
VGLVATTPISIAAAMFLLSTSAFAIRAVSFGLFMMALTPLVVLLVETGPRIPANGRSRQRAQPSL